MATFASSKRPPPPPVSQRPASVYNLTASNPVLPPPPILYQSPFDTPSNDMNDFDNGFASSETTDDNYFEMSPEDAATSTYYTTQTHSSLPSGSGDSFGDHLSEPQDEEGDLPLDDPNFLDSELDFGLDDLSTTPHATPAPSTPKTPPSTGIPVLNATNVNSPTSFSIPSPEFPVVHATNVTTSPIPMAKSASDPGAWNMTTPSPSTSAPSSTSSAFPSLHAPRLTMRVQSERYLGMSRHESPTHAHSASNNIPPRQQIPVSLTSSTPNLHAYGAGMSSSPESGTTHPHRTTPPSGSISPAVSTWRPPRPEHPPSRTREFSTVRTQSANELPLHRSSSLSAMNANIPNREAIAPFNFDAAALSYAQSSPSSSKGSLTMSELKGIIKQLWVPGVFPLGSRTYQGQTVSDCFVGWQLVQWLQQKQGLTLPEARQTVVDLLENKFICYAINVTNPKPTFEEMEQYLYRLSLPTAPNGAVDHNRTLVRPSYPPARPATAAPLVPPSSSSPILSTSPPVGSIRTSASIGSTRELDRITVQEVRERPTKFLRRTTREIQTQQAERAREASWVPQEIRGDWNVSIWDDEPQHSQLIVLAQDDQGKTIVDSGTLNSLIRHLSSELTDMTYTKTFFVTYKAFATREVLLPKILQRFMVPNSYPPNLVKTIQVRVVNAILKWLELAPHDWDQELIEKLEEFIRAVRSSPEAAQHEPLMKKLDKGIVEVLEGVDKERRAAHLLPPPPPILPKQGIKTSGLQLFFDLDALEIARQMTLMDWRIFSQIKSTEMLNCAWSSEKLKHRSPHILAMISLFNKWSNWVATIITLQPAIKVRAKVMAKFIDIAYQLRVLNNFSGVVAMLSGLNNAAVYRLNKTKELLKEKHKQRYDALIPLVDTSKSHRNYREAIRQAVPPVLPHLGVFLTDLTFINEGNKDVVNGNMINFKKHQMVYDVITQVRQFQQEQYNLEPQPTIQEFLTLRDDQMRSDTQLYEMSLKVEPRDAQQ